MANHIDTHNYVNALQREFATGRAKEHSYRPALKTYLEALLPDTQAVNEPARQACGAPDFVVSKLRKGQLIDVGYIEAKDVNVSLDDKTNAAQLNRYLAALDNFIYTNYLEFRFYKNRERVATICVAELDNFFTQTPCIKPIAENFEALETMLADFVEFKGQNIKSSSQLAEMMARKAQMMRDVFAKALKDETTRSSLHDQLEAFQKILIHDMSADQFADVYAQTIAYGLFTARLHDTTLEDFTRIEARELIPRSNPFLRRLFDYVCGAELDDRVVWIVDALCEVYRAADVYSILQNFGKTSGRNDPIIHFYETFLGAYDPKLRKSRGVWYTPEPVVNFIVRAVDEVLQTHFGLVDGLADTSKVEIEVETHVKGKPLKTKQSVHRVQLLDVAAGTGTFTAEAIKQIHTRFVGQQGMWSGYVENHLLPRLHGFEILMASYAMCHLKIDLLLTELNYKPSDPKKPPRLGVYLTNSLEEYHPDTGTLFASWLAHEANEASRIKRDMPIMAAYGNPPYSVSSQNKGDWIKNLIADYKKDLNEKNINPLSDDYIKFIRNAEHYIEKTGYGIVAMITNNSFLDGIIHRQMRQHLLTTFDHIYILDLHGSTKKKETSPDGSPDKNVFDIQQGVCIFLMVKDGSRKGESAQLKHCDIYGSRSDKYKMLWEYTLKTVPFEVLQYKEPYYFFVPKDFSSSEKYELGFLITDFFSKNMSGIKTGDDKKFIQFKKSDFHNSIDNGNISKVKFIDYRPFDTRAIFYDVDLIQRPRLNFMSNLMEKENISLNIVRQLSLDVYKHVYCSNKITDLNSVSLNSKEQTYSFPLYLYPAATSTSSQSQGNFLENAPHTTARTPNLNMEIVSAIALKLALEFVPDHELAPPSLRATPVLDTGGSAAIQNPQNSKNIQNRLPRTPEGALAMTPQYFTPLDLLDYIYAVLHSPHYRETYKEFLKIDFPRIPYPDNAPQFWQLVALGREIRSFHLLEHSALGKPITTFPVDGDCVVEKPKFENGRVYINAAQYFDGVPELAWNFYIGGYQPAQKWLKDRKGRTLDYDDIRHYQKIIIALSETDRLMKEIEQIYQI